MSACAHWCVTLYKFGCGMLGLRSLLMIQKRNRILQWYVLFFPGLAGFAFVNVWSLRYCIKPGASYADRQLQQCMLASSNMLVRTVTAPLNHIRQLSRKNSTKTASVWAAIPICGYLDGWIFCSHCESTDKIGVGDFFHWPTSSPRITLFQARQPLHHCACSIYVDRVATQLQH